MIKPLKLFLIGMSVIFITSFFLVAATTYVAKELKDPIMEIGKELFKKDTVYQIIIHQQDTSNGK